MQNATVPTADGAPYYLHIYTFAAELLSIVKAGGSFQEKRDIYLHSFHNEMNGVDYSNKDSVNGLMPVFLNLVATGTSTSLNKFINSSNIGDGLATRLTTFVMPTGNFKMRPLNKKPKSMKAANEMIAWARRFDALKGEIKGLDKLVAHVYNLIALRAEEAAAEGDEVTLTMLKRMQDKVMALCIPQVISTQKSWDEFQQTMTVKITRRHLDFATLMFEIIFACEDALFGQMWQDYFDNEHRNELPRVVYDKTNDYFQQLPRLFTTNDVKTIWGYTSNTTASTRISTLIQAGAVKKLRQGHFEKITNIA
jgi:hypothetical protein